MSERTLAKLYAAAADVSTARVSAETWWDVYRAVGDEGKCEELVCTVSDRADALTEGRGAYGCVGRVAAVQVLGVAVDTAVAYFRLSDLHPLDESRDRLRAAALRKLTQVERAALMENT